jgi:dimethylaniline monooxygenase (N-oxide forming)
MDVCIIGAGWSGIYACKYALENGLRPIVLEKRSDLGGVWNYSDDPNLTTVMKSTISSSSRIVTEASDFFMDESVGHFMHHEDVVQYLRDYSEKFDLESYLNFGCDVTKVEKVDGRWHVHYEQEGESRTVVADRLAVCAGLHNKKKTIGQPISNFTGQIIHAGDIKEIHPDDFGENDRVLVYGGGETASDIIDLMVKTSAKITWGIRGGQHFLRKTLFHQRHGVGEFDQHDFALDLIASPVINGLSPFAKGAPGRRYLTDFLSTGSFFGFQGHGISKWRNEYRYAETFFNKNGHSVEHVKSGRVSDQDEVVAVDGNRVTFKSGATESFTHIICCFGYEFHCPFLPEPYNQGQLENLYQYVFATQDPSVAFLGFARPIIGSIPLLTEMQCLWTFRVWSDKITLPSRTRMEAHQQEINDRWDIRLPGRGNLRTLVLPSTYVSMMIKSAYPDRKPGEHLKRQPMRALKFLTWIPSASMKVALDPELSSEQFNQLWKQRRHGILLGYVLPVVIVVSRFLRIEKVIDWYVDRRETKASMERTDRSNPVAKNESQTTHIHSAKAA